jgi:hypothetical protein
LAYTLLFLLKGRLPWQGYQVRYLQLGMEGAGLASFAVNGTAYL